MSDRPSTMRTVLTLFDGRVHVSYSQMYLDSDAEGDDGDMRACFAGQVNGLAGAAVAGHVFLVTGTHTGSVGVTVELHEHAPEPADHWEEAVEVSFVPGPAGTRLDGWAGGSSDELELPAGRYRLRYCAVGLDEAHDGVVTEDEPLIDRFLLQFWPAPPAPDAILRQSSRIAAYWHGVAADLPSAADLAHDRLRRAVLSGKAAEAEQEAIRRRRLQGRGTRIPAAGALADLDDLLVERVAALPSERKREIAEWALRRAFADSGLDTVEWIARAATGRQPLPAPFDDHPRSAWVRLFDDADVPRTVVTPVSGPALPVLQQVTALPAVFSAADPDPDAAAFGTLAAATATAGRDGWPRVLTDLAAEFPELDATARSLR